MIDGQIEQKRPQPVVLIILDGWGVMQPYSGNAISQADIPNFNDLIIKYPAMTLRASGEAVGLPWGEVGNSEVGHMNLGAGRIIYQDLPKINKSISDNSFFKNKVLLETIDYVKQRKTKLHLLGLASNGGVHSSLEHLQAILILAKERKLSQVFIHIILDGRDTPYNSGLNFVKDIKRFSKEYGIGKIATVSGRFYAMDRNNKWDRTARAYYAMALGEGNKYNNPVKAIEDSYNKKVYDEEFAPTVITSDNKAVARVESGDGVIFYNFRPDRARQITKAFILPGFEKFDRKKSIKDLFFTCFTEYEKDLPVKVVFPQEIINNTLGETISQQGLRQLRVAETEKYAHVTYFFNGGRENKFKEEEHLLISSPKVQSYDLSPEMSALKITDELIKSIDKNIYDFILINYANPDMVGHTGNLKAAVLAIEATDRCLGRVVKKVLEKEGILLITADHGNAEFMFDMQTGMINKEHTTNPVPLIIVSEKFEGKTIGFKDVPGNDLSLIKPQGILSDVAPTIIKIMSLDKPREMTGRSLI